MSQDKPREFYMRLVHSVIRGEDYWQVHEPGVWLENKGAAAKFIHVIDKRAFDRVVEALKFYADEERWGDSKDIARPTGNKCFDICLFDFDRSFKKGIDVAGAKARQALKDVGVDV